ncbi:MAG TPA: hypothetical protein PK861_00290 [Thermomonas sp.]|nr:hypothetical protein [Thermomonas sp.]
MNADAIATPPGAAAPKIAKRSADDRLYLIDCRPLLRRFELLSQVLDVQAPGLSVSLQRPRSGVFLEVRVAGGTVPTGQPHKDHALSASLRTSQGTVAVAVDFRVYP